MKYLIVITLCLFSFQFSMAQDTPDGPYQDYYDSGELKEEGQYKNNKRIGQWKMYYRNGQVSKVFSYNDGKYNNTSITYYDNGTISNKTELEDGVYVTFGYYKNGNLDYKRQDESGYFKSYYESGAKEIEANYFEFDLVGEWKKYYENGKLEWLVTYKEGYRHGSYKKYDENGNLILEGTNLKDKVSGEEKRYLPSNILEWKGNYSKGVLDGTWIKYNQKGKKIEKIKFKQGISSKPEYNNIFKPTIVADGVIERVPIYPGCEEMLTNKTRKQCMNINVNQFIGKNFNTDLALNLNLIGRQRITLQFKIDKTGQVIEAKAKAPHPGLAKEAVRVINLLPTVEPAYQRDKPVIIPYSIPIVFQVQK
ncbi:energy transducer TonB [Winogradskyella helgolandensis]|uniref:energy transducer TonB n=1 Tax=Winogradskyella helgolandensis TaxID=2697010 RepID=UPI0015CE0CA0|nr:energy transducer TonB [Winogradskyella helgolandensis]